MGTPIKVNLIHSYDVANAMLQSLSNKSWGVFNVADKTSYSIINVAQTCVKIAGKGHINLLKKEEARKPVSRFGLNCRLAQKAFNFQTTLRFEDGVRKMWLDIEKNIKVKNV